MSEQQIITINPKEVEQIVSPDLPKIIEFSNSHKIIDAETYQQAIDFAVTVKRAEKFYDFEKKKILSPFETALKAMKAGFSSKLEVVENAGFKITQQIGAWAKKMREEQEAADKLRREEAARKAAEELELARETAAIFGDAKSAHDLKQAEKQSEIVECTSAPVEIKKEVQRSSTGGSVSTRKYWKFRVKDLTALMEARPDLVIVEPNNKVINSLIAGENGVRELPGLEIYCEESFSVRT